MRRMPAIVQHQRCGRAADPGDDGVHLGRAAVLVVAALEDDHRHLHPRQQVGDGPVGERRAQPGVRPGVEQGLGVVAVVAGEPDHAALGKGFLRLANPLQGAGFDERVRGDGDQAAQVCRLVGGVDEGDGAAVRVADEDVVLLRDEGIDQPGQFVPGQVVQVVRVALPDSCRRAAVAGPVVEQGRAVGAPADALREVLPLGDRAQPLVQEDEPGPILAALEGLVEQPVVRGEIDKRHGTGPDGGDWGRGATVRWRPARLKRRRRNGAALFRKYLSGPQKATANGNSPEPGHKKPGRTGWPCPEARSGEER